MTPQQFNLLDKHQQRHVLLTEGTFLDERSTQRHDVMLYELNGFYTEAYFAKNTNRASFFKTFSDTELLEPYLTQINLHDLMEQAPQ